MYAKEKRKSVVVLAILIFSIATVIFASGFLLKNIFGNSSEKVLTLELNYGTIVSQNELMMKQLTHITEWNQDLLDELESMNSKLSKLELLDHIKLSVETQEDLYNTIDELIVLITERIS